MYLINKEKVKISKISERQFFVLGINERNHLYEWIVSNFDYLGEKLLIIQKDFDRTARANQRFDLLALDKQGNLVLIKNELDNSGNDVIWQVVKYPSYSFNLSLNQIKSMYQQYLDEENGNEKADDNLIEFYQTSDYENLFDNRL